MGSFNSRLLSLCPCPAALLDLPLLTVTPCGPDMCVELQPPVERLRDIYDSLQYKLLMSNDADKFQVRYMVQHAV